MRTAVVILNWNTKGFLDQFIPGVLASAGYVEKDGVWTPEGDVEVIVADSASSDGSMELMAEKFPKVRLLKLDQNYGFTGGYDRALGMLEGFEYYVLLNSDIEVPKGWIEPLVEWMDSHPDCGACAPKLHAWQKKDTFEYAGAAGGLIDPFGYTFCRGRIMSKVEKDEGQYDEPTDVLWATGACLMVRTKVWEQMGGLDSRFFAHMEEIDLCWRMQLEGWKVTVVPYSVVYHVGGGTLPSNSPFKLFLNFRNNLLMLENNLAKTYSLNMTAGKAYRKARRRILMRMVLDGGSAAVYLLTGKKDYFQSVVNAHAEYKKLRRVLAKADVQAYKESHSGITVHGLCSKLMIPAAFLKGDKVFEITRYCL